MWGFCCLQVVVWVCVLLPVCRFFWLGVDIPTVFFYAAPLAPCPLLVPSLSSMHFPWQMRFTSWFHSPLSNLSYFIHCSALKKFRSCADQEEEACRLAIILSMEVPALFCRIRENMRAVNTKEYMRVRLHCRRPRGDLLISTLHCLSLFASPSMRTILASNCHVSSFSNIYSFLN